MIRYIPFKFIIEKYVSHLKNHARILQKNFGAKRKSWAGACDLTHHAADPQSARR